MLCVHAAARADTAPDKSFVEVHFLDVGYGAAQLVRTPWGDGLVDGGEADRGPAVVRYLRERGVTRLVWVVLTHFHPDHSGGLPAVIDAFEIGELYLNQDPAKAPTAEDEFDDFVVRRGLSWRVANAASPVASLGEVRVETLAPVPSLEGKDPNSRSIVLRLVHGTAAVLLSGDATTLTDEALLAGDRDRLRADVLYVPHHGWGPGSTPALIAAVAPQVAVLSVGPSRWPAPDPEILGRYEGTPLLRTDRDGAIVVRTDGRTLTASTAKGRRSRPLEARALAPTGAGRGEPAP